MSSGDTHLPAVHPMPEGEMTGSSQASMVDHELEKKRSSGDTTDQEASDVAAEGEYPKGAKLAFIIVALALSIFLVALDMVRPITRT